MGMGWVSRHLGVLHKKTNGVVLGTHSGFPQKITVTANPNKERKF